MVVVMIGVVVVSLVILLGFAAIAAVIAAGLADGDDRELHGVETDDRDQT